MPALWSSRRPKAPVRACLCKRLLHLQGRVRLSKWVLWRGARHDLGAAREHRIIDALAEAEVQAVADTAYQGAGPHVAVPQRRRRLDPDTGRYRRLSAAQKQVNTAHARMRGPGERVNAELKNWRILRKIRSCPRRASELVAAVQTLMIANA